jgi:hypothetical protein
MSKILINFIFLIGTGCAGYILGIQDKLNIEKYLSDFKKQKNNIIQVSKKAYQDGCLHGFNRSCQLLKKNEQKECIEYSKNYCSDAASNYVLMVFNHL